MQLFMILCILIWTRELFALSVTYMLPSWLWDRPIVLCDVELHPWGFCCYKTVQNKFSVQ